MSEDAVTLPDLVTLTGYGLGLWWAAGGPTWAGLVSIAADEVDGRLARATNTTTAHGSALDWGADVALVPPVFARLGSALGVGRTAGLVASPVALYAQSRLRAEGERPSVGSVRAFAMLATMGLEAWRNGKFSRSRRVARNPASVGFMRTILMNPRKISPRPAKRAPVTIVRVASNPAMPMMMQANPMRRRRRANPKRRRAGARIIMVNPRRRRHARRNPLIMPNPRRRRRRYAGLLTRRNPSINVMAAVKVAGVGLAAAGGSYLLNRYVIGKLFYKTDQHWNSADNRKGVLYRNAVRFVGAAALAAFFPGMLGAAGIGAMLYPFAQEMANWFQYRDAGTGASATDYYTPTNTSGVAPQGTQAALEDYAAALDQALAGY